MELLNTEAMPTPADQGNVVISDTVVINPTTTNELRFGFNRRAFSRFSGPTLIWPQASLAKQFSIGERLRLMLRLDANNVFKRPSFARPGSSYDLRSPGNFARFTGELGNFAEIGARFHYIMVFRLEF